MKTLAFSLLAVAGLALVGWQHQQLGQLRGENSTLQHSAAEADHLKSGLLKFDGAQTDAAAEIDRLREENRDLLKLRNEVNQLRDTRVEFQKVSEENQRLRSQPRPAPQSVANQPSIQPIIININSLYDRGLNTPEDTVQTFYWARREGNVASLSRCVTLSSSQFIHDYLNQPGKPTDLQNIFSIEIVARREVNSNTVQLGLVIHSDDRAQGGNKLVYTLTLQNGEWKLDWKSFNQ
jgi:hypothetical protein